MKEIVATDKAPKAIGPYSQAVKANGFLFCSGQVPINPETGGITGKTVADQTRQALNNLKAVIEAAGVSMENVVKTTVLLGDMSYFQEMNEVYASFFGDEPPARATFAVKGLPLNAMLEIEAVVIL